MSTAAQAGHKHAHVFSTLRREIQSGRWRVGDRLPSEAELVRRFGHSRITVGRALRDLQVEGLIERRAGSGTYVRGPSATGALSFGLLIPDLGETDIFEPMCQGMMASPLARQHALIWGSGAGDAPSKSERAWQLALHYLERGVSGVFFAPLEHTAEKDAVNQRIARAIDEARIPLVLLDRTLEPYPNPGRHDVVGIDNRAAGFVVAEHLLRLGCQRLAFVAIPNAAATVDAREAGYREALYARNSLVDRALVRRLDPDDEQAVSDLMRQHPDGIVCANDRTAGRLLHSLRRLGYAVPRDVRLAGIDDVEYASLLPIPLTTLRQPTRQIGEVALGVMLQRIAQRDLPPRDTRLSCELVVRESCGAKGDR
jgi:GntR family transcriptional regulator, arabinose operon transcriptional repressor